MNKGFEGIYEAPETYPGATKGKIVLYFLADMFAANTQISHPNYSEREKYTRETMISMLAFVSEKTMDVVFKSVRKNRKVAHQVQVIFDSLHKEKLEELEEIFYCGQPLTKREVRSASIDSEDARMASLLASVIDYEEELQRHIQKMRTPRFNQLPRP